MARAVELDSDPGSGFQETTLYPAASLECLWLGTPGPAQSLSLTGKAILVVVKFTYFSV